MNNQEICILVLLGFGLYLLVVWVKNSNQIIPLIEKKRVIKKKIVQQQPSQYNYVYDSDSIFLTPNGKEYPQKIDYAVKPSELYEPTTTNQTHPDYFEVTSVLDKLAKKSVFNPAALPVITITDGEKKDIFPIAHRFVLDLSRKSKANIKLIDVIHIKKFTTEDQEKVQFDLIISKESPLPTKIKMLLRVSIVFNLNDVIDENNFFDMAWETKLSKKPILDEVFVLGYSNNYFDIESQAETEYYAFRDINENNFMDDSTVNNIVRSVRRKHALETGCINVQWDEDGRDYYVSDLNSTAWGKTDRRNNQMSKTPKLCSSLNEDELYGSIGTNVLDN